MGRREIMDKPFDITILERLRTIAETIAEIPAQFCKLRRFFLLGGYGSHNQHRTDVRSGEQVDLGDRYLAAEFGDLFQELFNVLWWVERCQGTDLVETR